MSIINNTNYSTITNNLFQLTQDMNVTTQRLSTGLRINSVQDDPSGIVMSENLKHYSSECDTGIQTAQMASTFTSVLEDALEEVNTQLEAINEIVSNAQDDSMTTSERTALQEEIDTRWDTINSIFDDSTFKGETLFDGAGKSITIGAGPTIGMGSYLFSDIATSWTKGDISSSTNATNFFNNLDSYMDNITTRLSTLGSFDNLFATEIDIIQQKKAAYEIEGSIVRDADIAEETANLTTQQMLQSATTSMLGNINSYSSLYISLVGKSSIY